MQMIQLEGQVKLLDEEKHSVTTRASNAKAIRCLHESVDNMTSDEIAVLAILQQITTRRRSEAVARPKGILFVRSVGGLWRHWMWCKDCAMWIQGQYCALFDGEGFQLTVSLVEKEIFLRFAMSCKCTCPSMSTH